MHRSRTLAGLIVLGSTLSLIALRANAKDSAAAKTDTPSADVNVAANTGTSEDDNEQLVDQADQADQVQIESTTGTKKPRKPRSTPSTGGGRRTPSSGGGKKCGVELWSVKTLADADADKVQVHNIQDVAVHDLITSPGRNPYSPQGSGANYKAPPDKRYLSGPYSEMGVYRIKAIVTTYKLESDSDYHIVAQDPNTGETMVVESVDPACAGASQFADSFSTVRQQFSEVFSTPPGPNFISVHQPVTIIGVGMYDPAHGQNGAAPNGRELHPILCISSGSECDQYQ